ncbi:hypothetical protein ACEPAH_3159 [Sanghuangporus vaninii]
MAASHVLEVASGPQNLAKFGISQEVIDRLQGLDLSGRVHDAKILCGVGGYADVSQGELKPLGRDDITIPIAIKRMRFYLRDDIRELFQKEIYVWSKFNHENVIRLLGYSFDNYGYPLLVSKWMRDGSAWAFVNSYREADVLPLIVGIAKGLNYLHEEMDAIHSDIKGINVLVSSSNPPRAIICDFGMSRIVNASLSLGRPSPTMSGTTHWLAYEAFQHDEQHSQLNNEFIYTKKMDVWAFGMTIYELFSRRRPYDKYRSEIQVMAAIRSRELPQFDDIMGNHRGSLFKNICQKCWKFDPEERITVRGVLDVLHHDGH